MHKITVMSKPGCHLCEVALQTVQRVVGSHVAALIEEVDITQDRDAIPVVLVDGVERFRYSVDPDKLAQLFYGDIQQKLLGF